MSQTAITFAFEQWKAKEATGGTRVVLDEFVFANVPGLDPNKPIDRKEGMPAAGHIVHRQSVNKTGVVNSNTVVYSVTLGTEIGDFDFNWIGLVNKASGTVAMVIHAPTQRKVANRAGQQGNAITRSFLMEYDGAAKETGITTPAETWQIDFTARLGGIDDMQRLINRDHYGAGAFFGNGFLVVKNGAQYVVNAGTGYVGGLRAVLAANQTITVGAKPVKVWVDASYQGNVVSQWAAVVKLTVAATAADYTDAAGFKHYLFAVASIDAAGNITDLRPKGSLSDQTGNEAFLRKDKNLADLKNPAVARGSLGLGTAATRNVGIQGGQLMEVGAFGLGSGSRHRDDAYCNQAEIFRVNNTSKNAPGREVYGVLSLPCDGGPSGGYLAVQNNGDAFFGRSNIASNGVTWFQAYTTKFKPTAADVGALTDAQAAQKYALRSFKVNGKPLSGDVNLVAGDVNAWNKTEADARYVKRVGDDMTGPLKLPRLKFPDVVPVDGDNDLKRPDGFVLETLGDQSKNYPLTNGKLGNLITFKSNMYRNVQFAIGSGNTEFWLRSLREDSPQTARNWARVYTTDYKPTITDVQAADHSNNFAARMGVVRVLTGANKPTSPGPWSVENSSWTPVPWGSLYVSTNGTNLSTASGNGKFIHYLFIAHGTANKFYVATDVNGGFTGWESYLSRIGGQLSGAVKSSAEITAKYLSTPAGAPPEGSGAYAAQLETKAPFYQENFDWDVAEGGRYVPLVKGRSNRKGQGYPTAVSFGYLLDGQGSFAKPCIHVRGDNNAEAIWRFDPNNKQFYAPGNVLAGQAILHTDGNITGNIWGGYLSNWLNNQFTARDNNINNRVDWATYNRDVGARATIDYVNSRSAVAGGRNAWWYKDEVTGFIIQGGVVNRGDYVNRVGFPRGYVRECFGVQLTLASSNGRWFGDSRVNIQARDLDNNGFNAMMDGQEQVVFWQSVGV